MEAKQRIWGTLDPFHEGGEIMGRSVANDGFLQAFLAADPFDEYHFFLQDQKLVEGLGRYLEQAFPALWSKGRFRLETRLALPRALAQTPYHCFHLSDCINSPAHLAALRNAYAPQAFPITGLTHSLSYTRYTADFMAHLWEGTCARDCVVATSTTARAVVQGFYDHLSSYFGDLPRPTVRTIPLGVDVSALRPPTGEERIAARESLDLEPDECGLLIFARISHFSKMDLVPVLRAVRRMQKDSDAKVRLLVAGWTDKNEEFSRTLKDLATNLGLRLDVIARPDEARKRELFSAADVFLSPVDNAQETFGITVLEAGAMGLPSVVSDYDGYRDLVQDEKTGFLVPTLGPDDTAWVDRLAPLVYDNESHLMLSQQTVVDVPELAGRLQTLYGDEALRHDMGRRARERVVQKFSWQEVVRQYCVLWDELWKTPVEIEALRGHQHPLHLPYSKVFGGYPTRNLSPDTNVIWTRSGEAVYRDRDFITLYGGLEEYISVEMVKKVLFFARRQTSVHQLMTEGLRVGLESTETARLLILWALKNDYLEYVPADEAQA